MQAPLMAYVYAHTWGMLRSKTPANKILAANLIKLMDRPGAKKISTYDVAGYRKGEKQNGRPLSPKTVERMRLGELNVTLDHLQAVANFFLLQPWQLLVPHFKPDDPPHLAFTDEEKAAYKKMEESIAALEKVHQGRFDGM